MRPLRLRFDYIPYPLWRRRMPGPLGPLLRPLLHRIYPARYDGRPPASPAEMAHFLARWRLIDAGPDEITRRLSASAPPVEPVATDRVPQSAPAGPVRLPAQWEPMESIILSWPIFYPPLWALYARMAAAILPVAGVTVLVPAPIWAGAVALYLEAQGVRGSVRYLALPVDDVWVRDYGPLVGYDGAGGRVAIDAQYHPLPSYPQGRDNAMVARWAAHESIPVHALDLSTEGGNIWTDGAGTLIMSDEFQRRDRSLGRAALEARLGAALAFDKLIITPHLREEETGHVDLLVKLADARTVLITEPDDGINGDRLKAAADLFRRETNARGEPYAVHTLPALPRYFNWGLFSIWRSYTNALTVNGRVLVPVYEEPSDEIALTIYEHAMPGFEIVPVDCAVGINGGGAVHCMTKEVPT